MEVFQSQSLNNRFSRITRIIVCGLKVIGLAPFSVQKMIKPGPNNSRKSSYTRAFSVSKIGLAYNTSLSILVLIIGLVATPHLMTMTYPNKSPITQIIDILQAVLRTLTSSVIILSWAFRQERATSIMNRLLEVDRLLSGMKKDLACERTSLTFFMVQMTLNALFWVTFWATEHSYIQSVWHFFIFNVPIFIIHWFVMEYAIVLGVAARELESFNNNLIMFEQLPDYLFFTLSTVHHNVPVVTGSPMLRGQLASLELLHSVRTTLSEVSQDISDFFSLLILPAVGCFSLSIVSNLYYLVFPLVISIDAPPIYTALNVVVWIFISVLPLLLLSFNVTKTTKQAKLTGLVVHKLLATAKGQLINTELEQFSLQLIHEDLSFTAYGFFRLDFTMIQAIFGTTATYLIIIIQFM